MSKTTTLGETQLTQSPHDVVSVRLDEPGDLPPTVLIHWPTARVLASLRAPPPTGRLVCPRPIDHSHTCASVVSSRTSTGWLVLHEPDPGWFGALILATPEASTRMLAALEYTGH
jgi:hypothetical protein